MLERLKATDRPPELDACFQILDCHVEHLARRSRLFARECHPSDVEHPCDRSLIGARDPGREGSIEGDARQPQRPVPALQGLDPHSLRLGIHLINAQPCATARHDQQHVGDARPEHIGGDAGDPPDTAMRGRGNRHILGGPQPLLAGDRDGCDRCAREEAGQQPRLGGIVTGISHQLGRHHSARQQRRRHQRGTRFLHDYLDLDRAGADAAIFGINQKSCDAQFDRSLPQVRVVTVFRGHCAPNISLSAVLAQEAMKARPDRRAILCSDRRQGPTSKISRTQLLSVDGRL